ncbi:MAG: hypothetical protein HC855_06980 [Rhizobiales bacterium]|nr:hypothetical protein [Hyphomicrobiales bacterium]
MRVLPVMNIFSHSIRSVIDNIGFAFHVSWPWMLAILPIHVGTSVYAALNMPTDAEPWKPMVILSGFVSALATMVAFASIAVNWHRYILLDEIPQGAQRLRLDSTVWRYVGNTLLIFLIMFLILIVPGIILGILTAVGGAAGAVIGGLAMFAGFLFAIAYFYRMSVKLPSIALGRHDYSIGTALKDTDGNTARFIGLAALFFAVAIAIGLLVLGLQYAIVGIDQGVGPGLYAVLAIQLILNWLTTIWGVTLLTSLYGYFAEGRDV